MGVQEEKENALWDWVNSILNPTSSVVPVIWEAENGPRPDSAYLQLNIINDTPRGMVEKSLVNPETGEQTLIGHGDLTLSIQSFGAGSNEYLNTLKETLDKNATLELLDSKGFAVRDVGAINAVPEIIDEAPEKRWVMEVTFGYAWSTVDLPGYILNVEYSGDYSLQ